MSALASACGARLPLRGRLWTWPPACLVCAFRARKRFLAASIGECLPRCSGLQRASGLMSIRPCFHAARVAPRAESNADPSLLRRAPSSPNLRCALRGAASRDVLTHYMFTCTYVGSLSPRPSFALRVRRAPAHVILVFGLRMAPWPLRAWRPFCIPFPRSTCRRCCASCGRPTRPVPRRLWSTASQPATRRSTFPL